MKVNKQQKRTQKNRTRRKNWVKNHRTWSKQQNNNKPGRKIAAAAPNTDMHNRYKKLAPWTAKAIKEEEKSQGNKTRNHQSKTTTSHQNVNQQSTWQKQRNVGCTCQQNCNWNVTTAWHQNCKWNMRTKATKNSKPRATKPSWVSIIIKLPKKKTSKIATCQNFNHRHNRHFIVLLFYYIDIDRQHYYYITHHQLNLKDNTYSNRKGKGTQTKPSICLFFWTTYYSWAT